MKTVYLQNWKFTLENRSENPKHDPWAPGFDDNCWDEVIVPHDWAVTFPFSEKWSSGTGYLRGGTGWYRSVFRMPEHWDGKQAFLCFDGVYKDSHVWCNGYFLGKHPNGYTGFRYDISHCLRKGDNIIAVKVSHEDFSDSRWYTGSGIYRKVFIRFYESVYIDDYTITVRTAYHDDEADIAISGEIYGCKKPVQLTAFLEDTEENVSYSSSISLGDKKAQENVFKISVKARNPKLWSPETPHLYKLSLELREEGADKALFRTPTLRIGIRTIQFDPDKGFFLNGNSRKIKGVCVHHDAGCLGAAVWPDVWRRRLEKLKNMGCDAIRTSHNPHMDELYDLCDEMGFLVMDEAFDEWEGCKNKWTCGHNVYPPVHQGYAWDFPLWHRKDMEDMIIKNRNHPSIIMWSIGNEIDYPNDPYAHPLFTKMAGNNDANKPKQEMMYSPDKQNMERLAVIASELAGIIKKLDPTRPVLLAAAFPELSSQLGFFDSLDIVGYNYKEHLYEADHRRFPMLPILGSETKHSVSSWKTVRNNEYISAQFLWTGIDYLGEAKGWPVRGSESGLLDCAGNEKTAYFRRQAMWLEKPVMYMASRPKPAVEGISTDDGEIQPRELFRCWDYLPGESVEVVCYTNLERAELFCNGKSCGVGARDADGVCIVWTIPFERGELSARGIGADAVDTLESVLPPVQLSLREWKAARGGPAACGPVTGADSKYRIAQIEAALLDEKHRLCVRGSPVVNVTLSGPVRFLGMENGDIADCTEYLSHRRHLHHGRVIIYVLVDITEKESCVLTASTPGLLPAVIKLGMRN